MMLEYLEERNIIIREYSEYIRCYYSRNFVRSSVPPNGVEIIYSYEGLAIIDHNSKWTLKIRTRFEGHQNVDFLVKAFDVSYKRIKSERTDQVHSTIVKRIGDHKFLIDRQGEQVIYIKVTSEGEQLDI